MTQARKRLVNYTATTKYLITCRCVRLAFLCGKDEYTNQDYEHRRGWLEDILLNLPTIFAIDIASYAIMSNHFHLVISVDTQKVESWSRNEIIKRWHKLYNGTVISQAFVQGTKLSDLEESLIPHKRKVYYSIFVIFIFGYSVACPMCSANIERFRQLINEFDIPR